MGFPGLSFAEDLTCRIGGHPSWLPYSYTDIERDALTGIAISLLRDAVEDAGAKAVINKPKPWRRVQYDLEHDTVDIIASAYFNADRDARFIYSQPFATDGVYAFRKVGQSFPYSGLEDAKNLYGVTVLGSSFGQKFDEYAKDNLDLQRVHSAELTFKMVAAGRADYGIVSEQNFYSEIYGNNAEDTFELLHPPVTVNKVYAMFSKTTPCLAIMDHVNDYLAQKFETGAVQEQVKNFFAQVKDKGGS